MTIKRQQENLTKTTSDKFFNLKSLPVFVINLPKSSERKEFMKAQCEIVAISPIFIDAIYGNELSTLDIEKYCDQTKAKNLFGRELLLGEIGCALSHKKIYQRIVDENIPYAVILEDDAVIKEGFHEVIISISSSDVKWDLVLLGHHKDTHKGLHSPLSVWGRSHMDSQFTLNYLADFGFGTYGYIMTIKGAKKLLAEMNKIKKPIDHYTSDCKIINVYALSPTIVNVHDDFDTLIDGHGKRSSKDRLSVILLKKIGIIDIAVSFKKILKTLKPIKKYK